MAKPLIDTGYKPVLPKKVNGLAAKLEELRAESYNKCYESVKRFFLNIFRPFTADSNDGCVELLYSLCF